VLDELAAGGITFLTLRQRGPKVLEALAALPASAWRTHNVKRAGRYRHPQIHEAIVHLKGIEAPLRQVRSDRPSVRRGVYGSARPTGR